MVCRQGFTISTAHAICQSNNFSGALGFTFGEAYGPAASVYGTTYPECTGYETSPIQCPYFNYNRRNYCPYDYMGVDCSSTCQILNRNQ